MDPARSEHAVCGDLAADAAQVERSARRTGRQRERHLEERPTREDLDRREPRAARRRSFAAESASTSRARIPRCSMRSSTTTKPAARASEGERDAYGRPIMEARIKAAEIYRSRRQGRDLAQGQREQRIHERTLGHLRLGVRPDSRRSRPTRTRFTRSASGSTSRATPAGRSRALRGTHGDHHGLWIDPAKPATLYSANDGGFYLVRRCGQDLEVRAGRGRRAVLQRDARLEHARLGLWIDPGRRQPARPHRSERRARQDPRGRVDNAPGGEGSHHAIDPADPNIVFSHGFYGNFTRTNVAPRTVPQAQRDPATPQRGRGGRGRGAATSIRPQSADVELRAQWMAPIIASVHEPGVIYAGYQFVYRSANRGASWERISPDLTSNDPSRMLLRNSNAIPFQTITALAESPRRARPALRRHRRRQAARDAGRRQDLDGADRERADPPLVFARRAVAARRGHGLRHPARPRRRRLRGLRLQVDRFRQDVHQPRGEHPRRIGERRPRASGRRRTSSTWARISAPSSRPTAAGSGRFSAVGCRRCRSRTSPTMRAIT